MGGAARPSTRAAVAAIGGRRRARWPRRRTRPTPTPTAPASTSPSRASPTRATSDALLPRRVGRRAPARCSRHGGALSHHHGVGLNRARFVAEALGAGFGVLQCGEGRARPERHPQPGQARPAVARSATARLAVSDRDRERPRRRRRHEQRARRRRRAPTARSRTSTTRELLPDSPRRGLVEFDAARHGAARARGRDAPRSADGGPGRRGRHRQPAGSTVVWDRATGEPVGPGLGWQDLRTVGACLVLPGRGPAPRAEPVGHQGGRGCSTRSTPTARATSASAPSTPGSRGRCRAARCTSPTLTNAAVTGLHRPRRHAAGTTRVLDALRHPRADAAGDRRLVRRRSARRPRSPGAPPIAGIARRPAGVARRARAASRPGRPRSRSAPAACSTSCSAPSRPAFDDRAAAAAPSRSSPGAATATTTWGVEAVMLSAGTNVRVAARRPRHHRHRAPSPTTSPPRATTPTASVYVPALLGLGTPAWDYGARGTLLGLTRGTGRPEIVRAVLEGVAQRGADLVEAAEADSGHRRSRTLRVDGGMTRQPDLRAGAGRRRAAAGRDLARCSRPPRSGAAFLAGLAVGTWAERGRGRRHLGAARRWSSPAAPLDRDRWPEAVAPRRRLAPRAVRPRLLTVTVSEQFDGNRHPPQ